MSETKMEGKMTANDVLSILVKRSQGAIVPEMVLDDPFVRLQNTIHQEDERNLWAGVPWNGQPKQGPVRPKCLDSHSRRIDAFGINSGIRTAYEIKVSHSDFLRETDAKRRAWMSISHRFIYVCPAGIIQPEEVPEKCGLQWVVEETTHNGRTWHKLETKKRAVQNKEPEPIPSQIIVALFYRAASAYKMQTAPHGAEGVW